MCGVSHSLVCTTCRSIRAQVFRMLKKNWIMYSCISWKVAWSTTASHTPPPPPTTYRGRILGRNLDLDKSLKSFLYSFALRFLFLQTHATSYRFNSSVTYTVKEKGGKPDRKPYPLPYCLRNPYRNLKSENSQDHAQKHPRKCTVMNSRHNINR